MKNQLHRHSYNSHHHCVVDAQRYLVRVVELFHFYLNVIKKDVNETAAEDDSVKI